jgi:hypothetical protein
VELRFEATGDTDRRIVMRTVEAAEETRSQHAGTK